MNKIEGDINAENDGQQESNPRRPKNLFAEMVRKTGSKQSVLDRLLQEIETLRESHRVTSRWPSAWELWVRRTDTEWRRYSVYETHDAEVTGLPREGD